MALWVLRVLYSTLSELEGCARPRCLAGGFLHAKASGGAAVPLPVADGAGLTRAEQRRNREPVMDAVYDSYGRCPTLRVVTPGMGAVYFRCPRAQFVRLNVAGHFACCMMPVASCMLSIACCLLSVACCMLSVAWRSHAAWDLNVARHALHAACCMLHAACCMLHDEMQQCGQPLLSMLQRLYDVTVATMCARTNEPIFFRGSNILHASQPRPYNACDI